jgi:hypothetical protein
MTHSVLLLRPASDVDADVLLPHRVRMRDRVEARVRAHSLDRRLAAGEAPEGTPALFLRARRLIAPSTGHRLARAIDGLVRDLWSPRVPRARIAASRSVARAVAGDLDAIARRLADPQPVAVAGVARVRMLLTDGAGPLFSDRIGDDLRAAIHSARIGLELI